MTRSEKVIRPLPLSVRKRVGPQKKNGLAAVEVVTDRSTVMDFDFPHFTHICAFTYEPDFARVRIRYPPDQLMLEVKNLQKYLWHFRGVKVFGEEAAGIILTDLVEAIDPVWMQVLVESPVRALVLSKALVEHSDQNRVVDYGVGHLLERYRFVL